MKEFIANNIMMPVQITKRLLSVEDYHKMGEVGILQEEGIELIHGEIIEMSPTGSKNLSCVNLLTEILFEKLSREVIISIQNPVKLNDYSEPEPDISVLKRTEDRYYHQLPGAEDVLLIIEVADTSIEYDRQVKMPLYAENGIPEYWLINLEEEEIETYWHPAGNTYKFRELLRSGDTLQAINIDLTIPVDSIFG